MTEQSKEEFKENIQGWIDNRFGVPNTVNIQCFLDFSKFIALDSQPTEGELISDEEIVNTIHMRTLPEFAEALRKVAKAQFLHDRARFQKVLQTALKQSQAGEEIDLPEDLYELFCAIQNSGMAKFAGYISPEEVAVREAQIMKAGLLAIEEARQQERERITRKVESTAEPDYYTGSLVATIQILLDEELKDLPWWQALKSGKEGGE